MKDLTLWLSVAAGGSVGAVLRYAVSLASNRFFGHGFPWGTLIVNVTGSFCMGLLIAWLVAREPSSQGIRLFWAVGVLGAFTTFSTFSLDFVTLFERKAILAAGGYLFGSVALSITGLFAGLWLGRSLP